MKSLNRRGYSLPKSPALPQSLLLSLVSQVSYALLVSLDNSCIYFDALRYACATERRASSASAVTYFRRQLRVVSLRGLADLRFSCPATDPAPIAATCSAAILAPMFTTRALVAKHNLKICCTMSVGASALLGGCSSFCVG